MVRGMADAVHDRVAHVEIGVGHVDLRPQGARAVGKLPAAHAAEQVEVLLDGSIAIRAVPPRRRDGDGALVRNVRAAKLADFLLAQVAHVGLARHDELLGPRVELLEIVGGEKLAIPPVKAEPPHVGLDGVHVLLLFLYGVGVVEPEIARTAELRRDPEVDADRLGMADVQVPVGLGRPARADIREAPGLQVLRNGLAYEVGRGRAGAGTLRASLGSRSRGSLLRGRDARRRVCHVILLLTALQRRDMATVIRRAEGCQEFPCALSPSAAAVPSRTGCG